MNSSYGLDTYRSHDLNIAMKTSSGDIIKMDFSNEQAASFKTSQDENSSSSSMRFSSMQAFNFSMKSNGIDAQDQKEIDAFMKKAQPYIDSFLAELREDAPATPVTKIAHEVASIFDPQRERSDDEKSHIKTNIVKMFDNAFENTQAIKQMDQTEILEKIFQETQRLLEKTLQEFENFNKELYA